MLCPLPLALFDFSFAKLAQASFCKYRCTITAQNFSSLPHFLFPKGQGLKPKQNVVFRNFPCNSLHLHDFSLLLLYARKNYKERPGAKH